MKTRIILYGHLRARFGREFSFAIGSVAEGIRALCSQVQGFEPALAQGSYKVLVGQEAQTLDALDNPVSSREVIKLVPVVEGAHGDVGQILLGAALIWATAGWGWAFAAGSFGAAAMSAVSSIGWALVLGGVASMLASPPQVGQAGQSGPADMPSYAFGSPTVTVGQGRPVPLGYGEMEVGGAVVSAGIVSEAYQKGGFGGLCPPDGSGNDSGTMTGNGDSTPWMAAIQPAA